MKKRYWFEFNFNNFYGIIPPGTYYGCGITAYNYEEALHLLHINVFENCELPKISNYIENVDVSTLNKNIVIPNMKLPIQVGIWFPLGYD